jgi:crotonobetainyl-CoA:carnitine CoA-transferase CaiB-like acyl-CoA transferase
VMQDRQAVARGSYVEVETPAGGTTTIAAAPFRMDEAWRADPAPGLGEHTVELLDELGYSRPEQIALFRAGVTG